MATTTARLQEAREILAARLREIRSSSGLPGRQLADGAGWHFSKVSKIENARQAPSEEDIRAWCRICDAEGQTADLIAHARNIDTMYTEWRKLEETGMKSCQEAHNPLYHRTQQFRIYQHSAIPGLLQTAAYARSHLRRIRDFRGVPNDLDSAVAQRIDNQEVLSAPGKRFMFIIGEQALRTPLCAPSDMADQMDRLTEIARLPAISLGIIPSAAEPSLWPPENFWIYDGSEVRVDTVPGQYKIKAPSDIAVYEKAFSWLADSAVYGTSVRDAIEAARASFSS